MERVSPSHTQTIARTRTRTYSPTPHMHERTAYGADRACVYCKCGTRTGRQVLHTARFARPSEGMVFFTSPDRAAPLVFRLAATVPPTPYPLQQQH